MKKLSVVIPTLQKNKELLINLLKTLELDNVVQEIILINNSLQRLDYNSSKLRVVQPGANLYVNPSWNLGVKLAQNDIVALLNDDIIISNNFCSQVVELIQPEMGVIGFNSDKYMQITKDILPNDSTATIYLEEVKKMPWFWGTTIFFYKSSYYEIPDEMKITHGDCYLITMNNNNNKKYYSINGQMIYHYGSLSHGEKNFNPICARDKKIFERIFLKWYERIFSFKYLNKQLVIRLFGMKFSLRF